ncbi:MAG: SUMF1/EgtB/PvdO family nonheme iron enzyme [Victivallales bacterium]|nr:SUMF1/EgtB/PvdO family nonheme iron enzyme [Victivallales bacterium]
MDENKKYFFMSLTKFSDIMSDNGCETHPVGKKAANELGFCDMSGNVCEWCRDSSSNHWGGKHDYDDIWDPFCTSGSYKIVRGGCWRSFSYECGPAFRLAFEPSKTGDDKTRSYGYQGFRVALAPVQQ